MLWVSSRRLCWVPRRVHIQSQNHRWDTCFSLFAGTFPEFRFGLSVNIEIERLNLLPAYRD